MGKPPRAAVAYYRARSATNVGPDKDSLKRQQDAVQSHAAANGLRVVCRSSTTPR